jgi:multidrug efflux system outer membrane protein
MIRNIAVMVLIMVASAGCMTLAPDYSRPAPPVPEQWPTAEVTGNSKANDLRWDSFYKDEKLQKVIRLALENNRDLGVAALKVERAAANYQIQRAELFPVVKGSGTLTKERVPADLSDSGRAYTTSQYSLSVGVTSWELDLFGRIRSLKDKALNEYLATEQAARSTKISLVAEVASAYLTLAADRDSLKLVQSTLDAADAAYVVVKGRCKAGVSSELDLREAQTVVDTARSGVVKNMRRIALDKNTLNLLAGSTVPDDLLSDSLDGILLKTDLSPGIPSEVLLVRPDTLDAEYQLKAANVNIGAARAAFFPSIALTGSLGTTSNELLNLFKAGSHTWAFAPEINLPIFDAGSRRAELKVAKIDRNIYVKQYEKAIQTAFKEVADALAERATLGDQVAVQESLVQAWRETYRLSEARYLRGADTYLNALVAARSLYAAQENLITARLAVQTNLATLYKVLGGGN